VAIRSLCGRVSADDIAALTNRLAGLIFSHGPSTPDLFELLDADSTGMLAMAARLYFSVDGRWETELGMPVAGRES
jgi:hypothetical protein